MPGMEPTTEQGCLFPEQSGDDTVFINNRYRVQTLEGCRVVSVCGLPIPGHRRDVRRPWREYSSCVKCSFSSAPCRLGQFSSCDGGFAPPAQRHDENLAQGQILDRR